MNEQRFLSCYNEYFGVKLPEIDDELNEMLKFVSFAILYDKTPIGIEVLSVENIVINEVLAHYSLTKKDVICKTKTKLAVECRRFISVLIWQFTDKTFEKVGEVINRDYSTVIYSLKIVRESGRFAPAKFRKYIELQKIIMDKYELPIKNKL